MHFIVGFSGHIGSGKNYIAEKMFLPLLINTYPNKKFIPYFFSFGDQVKVECLCRIPYNDLSQNTGFHEFFIEKTQDTRNILQQYATENGRDTYHCDIWVRAVETWIDIQLERLKKLNMDYIPIFIISDVRFINELEFIQSHNGLIIRIEAPNRSYQRIYNEAKGDKSIIDKIKNHSSETSLDHYKFKHVINNDLDSQNIKQQMEEIINNFLHT